MKHLKLLIIKFKSKYYFNSFLKNIGDRAIFMWSHV